MNMRQSSWSCTVDLRRPYYHEFAWAYDLLQTDSVALRVDFIESVLSQNRIPARSTLLDAGCGTGRYTTELAKRGFRMLGVDQSADLIAIARNREAGLVEQTQFVVANLVEVSFPTLFDAVLCRGVLNDFVEDADRSCLFHRFDTWLRPGGILIFDVREWTRTLERYKKSPRRLRAVVLPTGNLEFQSETVLDLGARQMRIRERFMLDQNGTQTSTENDFVMRCWTQDEIDIHLSEARLDQIAIHPNYGKDELAWSDRLVVVASKRMHAPYLSSE